MGRIITQNNQIPLLVIVFCSICFSSSLVTNNCRIEEKTALLQFMSHFSFKASCYDGDDSDRKPRWNKDDDCCGWNGVECDDVTGHVIGLVLYWDCVSGTIPLNSSLFNLLHLETLDLTEFNLNNSRVSPLFGNLKNLSWLRLRDCSLSGLLPNEIFKLHKLELLDLTNNKGLTGQLTETIGELESLKDLRLTRCSFYGSIPTSIGKLQKLEHLDISDNNFSGQVPIDVGKLKKLSYLIISGNNFSGHVPIDVWKLQNLSYLEISKNNFSGQVPIVVGKLQNLLTLDISDNNFSGQVPIDVGKLKNLNTLDISKNNFSGQIPASLSSLQNLLVLDLSYNYLQGPILPYIVNLTGCTFLDLSVNQFTDTIDLNIFTNFIDLKYLDLSNSGASLTARANFHFPSNLNNLRLSSCHLKINILTNLTVLSQLIYVDLSNNEIKGTLHPSICENLLFIYYLDLSSNHFNGLIPSCLGNSSRYLAMLNLKSNNFLGTIPQSFGHAENIKLLDLSNNLLQGNIPKSLGFCTQLEVLNLGHNNLSDGFPFWLGNISSLKVVILRKNKLNGTLKQTQFANLHIIDMSHNDFTGNFSSQFFDNFDTMMIVHDKDTSLYSTVHDESSGLDYPVDYDNAHNDDYYYALNITNKGSLLPYKKVLTEMKVVDFSNNKLSGIIPSSIGRLKGIIVLNLSRNSLEGPIPWFLENLTNLESLDLSANMLSREIPGNLLWSNLNSLGFLDLSQNNLTGRIPALLDKFPNASYEKNPGLCGLPLSRLCSNPDKPVLSPPNIPIGKKHGFTFDVNDFGWEIVLIGYGCGMVFGLGIGSCITIRKAGWVARAFNL